MLLLNWYYLRYEPIRSFIDICSLITQTKSKVQPVKATRFTDLPDEILLIICEYLRPIDTLRAFLSSDISDRFHRLIIEYRTDINLSVLSYSEFRYMIDTILPQLDPSDLILNNMHIPCLIDQFLSSQHRFPLMKISYLKLNECSTVDSLLTSWLSKQSKLNVLDVDQTGLDLSTFKSSDFRSLRDFLFSNKLPSSVNQLHFSGIGLVLHNQLKSSIASSINYASLSLDTVDDLQILLSQELLGNVSKLHIHVQQKRQGLSQQELPLFLHNNLLEFLLIDYKNEITSEELAYFIRHMPSLQKLYVLITQTRHRSFARYSYFENLLSPSIVEFQFFTQIDTTILNNLETDINDKNVHRFPMKMHGNMIYTVPWRWGKLWSIPIGDYHQSCIDETKSLNSCCNKSANEISVDALKPWCHVTTVKTQFKLPSLEVFRCLRTLKTKDATIIHSILPSTLRSLALTDTTPLDLNAPLSTLVHNQVYKFILRRSIRDEQDLLNVLHQFPNIRFLSLNLPSTDSKGYLFHIFHNSNARLPHLICLQVYGGQASSWSTKPFEWLIKYTPLKYRSTLFYTTYCCRTKRLIIWL